MADDNPDSVVLELLALIAKQGELIATAMDHLEAAQSVIDRQQAQLNEYVNTHTQFYRPAQPEQQRDAAAWEPINSWVN